MTGQVIPLPLANNNDQSSNFSVCQSAYEGPGVEVRPESRLMIVRCGLNYDEKLDRNVPDVYYFVLEGEGLRKLAHYHVKAAMTLGR
jgi:hypothetical protein